jgi:hypothetical protein
LVPQPRELQATGQPFDVKPDTEIILSPATAAEDRAAGESLQEELKLVSGVEFPIVSAPSSSRAPAIRLARFGDAHVNAALQSAGLSAGGIGEQGYVLAVDPSGVVVAGKDTASLSPSVGVAIARDRDSGSSTVFKLCANW